MRLLFCLALIPGLATAQDRSEVALAAATLQALQQKSFAENLEYCGYIIRTAEGDLAATPAVPGDAYSCLADDPPEDSVPLASYHTHGGFEYDAPSEFPSVTDVEGDEAEGIDGYISTPGGRLWYVDGEDLIVSQICGIGCLNQDPAFIPGLDGDIAISYTYDELLALEAE